MTRDEAKSIFDDHTFEENGFKSVSFHSCREILGIDTFHAMLRDPIRNKGPSPRTVYPWNVIDYLSDSA